MDETVGSGKIITTTIIRSKCATNERTEWFGEILSRGTRRIMTMVAGSMLTRQTDRSGGEYRRRSSSNSSIRKDSQAARSLRNDDDQHSDILPSFLFWRELIIERHWTRGDIHGEGESGGRVGRLFSGWPPKINFYVHLHGWAAAAGWQWNRTTRTQSILRFQTHKYFCHTL